MQSAAGVIDVVPGDTGLLGRGAIGLGSDEFGSDQRTGNNRCFPGIASASGSLASAHGDFPTVAQTPEAPDCPSSDVRSLFALTYRRSDVAPSNAISINMVSAAQYTSETQTLEVDLNPITKGEGSAWCGGTSLTTRREQEHIKLKRLSIVLPDAVYLEEHSPTQNPLSRFFSVLSLHTQFTLEARGEIEIRAKCFPFFLPGEQLKKRADTNKILRWPQPGRSTTLRSPMLSVHLLQQEPYTEEGSVTTQIITLLRQLCQIVLNGKGSISWLNEITFRLSNFNFAQLPEDKKDSIKATVAEIAQQLSLESHNRDAVQHGRDARGRYTGGTLIVKFQDTEDAASTQLTTTWSTNVDVPPVAEYADTMSLPVGVAPSGFSDAASKAFVPASMQDFFDPSAFKDGEFFVFSSTVAETGEAVQTRGGSVGGAPHKKRPTPEE
ncbi:MAG: hypothetical protein V4623_11140 [Pseudomonadota bacterium]